jgi:hypothetical protein
MLIGRRTTLEWLRGRRHREGVRRPALCRPAVPLEVDRHLARRQRISQLHAAGVVHGVGGCYSGRASTRSGSERPYWRAACSGIMPLGARMRRISAGGWTAAGCEGQQDGLVPAVGVRWSCLPHFAPALLPSLPAMGLSADGRPRTAAARETQSKPAAHSCRRRRSSSST